MTEVFPTLLVLLIASPIAVAAIRKFPVQLQRMCWYAYGAHIAGSLALVSIYTFFYDRSGDMFRYHYVGRAIAAWLDVNPLERLPPIFNFILQRQDYGFPPFLRAIDLSSTSTMEGVTGMLMWLLRTDSIYAVSMFIAVLVFAAKARIALTLIDYLDDAKLVTIAMLLVPSTILWTTGIVKEAFAMLGLGIMFASFRAMTRSHYIRAAAFLVLGMEVTSITKPYLLVGFIPAVLVYFYAAWLAERGKRVRLTPVTTIMIAGLAAAGLYAIGTVFPQYSIENVGNEMAHLQAFGGQGGSGYHIGDASTRSLSGQLAFAPLALVYVLFRPAIFEVHNLTSAFNALETLLITIAFAQIVLGTGLGRTWRAITARPVLLASLVFVLIFGIGVGLSTTNVGTLSRYRVPMYPFFALLLLTLRPAQLAKSGMVQRKRSTTDAPPKVRSLATRRLARERWHES